MAPPNAQRSIWRLAAAQHGVITRKQLLTLGFGPEAIRHRVRKGRLHRVHRGVYAVGRPQLTQHGIWMAAALGCGPEAGLSHESAGALWGLRPQRRGRIEVSVPMRLDRGRPGLIVHRRARLELTRHLGIPLTDPALTLVDLATRLGPRQLEAAVNEADALNLITPGDLRAALERWRHQPGAPRLRALLDRQTFTLTDSELERLFLPLVRRVGLPLPATGSRVNGFRVDFHWADLGLVVETDGLRYHRTPGQQARDRLRDQAHTRAGLTPLRFTHTRVRYEPDHVAATLGAVAARLRDTPNR